MPVKSMYIFFFDSFLFNDKNRLMNACSWEQESLEFPFPNSRNNFLQLLDYIRLKFILSLQISRIRETQNLSTDADRSTKKIFLEGVQKKFFLGGSKLELTKEGHFDIPL